MVVSSRISIFYFVADTFPTWRVDLAELFSVQLRRLGVVTTWSVRRSDAGLMRVVDMHGQSAIVPLSLGKRNAVAKMLNRILEPVSEALIFLRLVFGKRHDVIQVRDDRYSATMFALLAARLRGARFTYWLSFPFPEHDLDMAAQSRGVRRWYLCLRGTLASWWLYDFVLRRVDHAFVQSARMRDNLVARGIPAERMTPMSMGVPSRLLDWAAGDSTIAEPGRIVYLGTLSESRRLSCILEAFALVRRRFPHARLWMIGEGDFPHERAGLEALASSLSCGDAVTFTGFVPMEEAWRLAKTAEVCLSPFVPTGIQAVASPTKLVEYMAMGRAVVANTHPEQTAILRQCKAGALVEWGAREFADGICSILADPETAARRAACGPAWVAAHRTYDRIAADVYKRYLQLLGTSDAVPAPIDP